MTAYEKIVKLLKDNNIQLEELRHAPVRTSEEAALTRPEISLSQGAKALIVKVKLKGKSESMFLMVVVPGDKRFDSKKVKALLGAKDITFAAEEDVIRITEGVLPGGVPPFGNIFGLRTIADSSILQHEKIAFNAGDRSISIIMRRDDWQKVVTPEIQEIA